MCVMRRRRSEEERRGEEEQEEEEKKEQGGGGGGGGEGTVYKYMYMNVTAARLHNVFIYCSINRVDIYNELT